MLTIATSYEDIADLGNDIANLLVDRYAATILARTTGTGYYEGTEETCGIILALVDENYIEHYRQDLAGLAIEYGQDAIGVTAADASTTLVYAHI